MIAPHGPGTRLTPRLVDETLRQGLRDRAASLRTLRVTTREASDLLMLGNGAFTPLNGFLGEADWRGVCESMSLADGTFWPIPITVSVDEATADSIRDGEEVTLADADSGEPMAVLTVESRYRPDHAFEAVHVFGTDSPEHPGVAKLYAQPPVNLAGPVQTFSELTYPTEFAGVYKRPAETRELFESLGWSTVAAFQTRNPMHRAHEHLAKIALEVCDGVMIHQVLGKLKPGDIPASVRVPAINALVENWFVPGTVIQAGFPLEMRYAGPREALLHAVIRQNHGCTHLVVGRDHAGVGGFYGPYDSQRIFDTLPEDALALRPLRIGATFWCRRCDGMASEKSCPHGADDRLSISGTQVRRILSEGGEIDPHFSRPQVLEVLRAYYASEAAVAG